MEVNAKQNDKIWMHIGACWRLRNILLADRIENRAANKLLKQQGVTEDLHYLSQSDQYADIIEYVSHDTALSKVHSQVRQNVAVRVDEGYKRFFDALKEGRANVHPSKFIERKKYRSITYPQYGPAAKIKNGKLHLSGLGEFRLFDYRKVKGKPKTVTVKFKQGRWHCIITEILAAHAKAEGRPVSPIKDIPYSNRLKSQIKGVAKLHTKVDNIRDHHHNKNASVVASRYRKSAVEEHGVQFMIRNRRLAKVATDRAIYKQKLLLKSKLGKRYIATPNQTENGGNSQTCTCGAPVPKELKDRIHHCPVCGLTAGRDHVAANIVSIIAFGIASLTLVAGSHSPEAGQVFVRRGEDKALCGESRLCESECIPASESSGKRQPSQALRRGTTGAEATVGGKTRSSRIADRYGIAT
jgi:transposase